MGTELTAEATVNMAMLWMLNDVSYPSCAATNEK